MWTYNKMLEFPVKIKTTNPKLAMAIMSQLGGPDGEKGASTRYLSQRYAMKDKRVVGVLTDIGTEELNHEEMVAAIITQLTKNLSMSEIENSGFYQYYVDHTIVPRSAFSTSLSATAKSLERILSTSSPM